MEYLKVTRPKGIKIIPIDTAKKSPEFSPEKTSRNIVRLITGSMIFWVTVCISLVTFLVK